METKTKNLLFQLLNEISTDITEQEETIFNELDQLTAKYPEISSKLGKLSDSFVDLHSNMKYQFFEWGILADNTLKTTNLNWKK